MPYVKKQLASPVDAREDYKLAITLLNEHYIWLCMQNSMVRDVNLP